MNKSLLQTPLTADAALKWLKDTLGDSEAGDTGSDQELGDPDEALGAILECEWESEEELLAFFQEVSIQLAQTATQSNEETTASLYDRELPYNLSLDSPYYELWEKAYQTNSSLLKEEIELEDWDTCLDSGISWLPAIALIPLATAYEPALFTALRDRNIPRLTSAQEEFLYYVASTLSSGYFEGEIPIEIIYAPSRKVLAEIFHTWTSHRDLWTPAILREALLSEYADNVLKKQIAAHLKNEQVDDEDGWREHLEYHWSADDLERVLELCE